MKLFRILIWTALTGASLAAASDVLLDEEVRVSPLKVRPFEFEMNTRDGRVLCTYHVVSGRSGVRAVLLKQDEMRQWLMGKPNHALAATGYSESGGFSFVVDSPGAYSIVIDNRMEGRDPAVVRLQVKLVSGAGSARSVRLADPERARGLVWGSVALFAALSLLAGWRIRLAWMRKQENDHPLLADWTQH